jgi:hypothetical protein
MGIAIQVIQWLVPLILGVVLTILLQDRLQWILARILSGVVPRSARNVKGIWEARYTYESNGQTKEERQLVELRQLGKHVRGKNLTAHRHWYKMRGKLELEIYLTGVWETITEGDIYHGAFQFVVRPEGNAMEGKWIGFNNKQEINHGPWQWSLLSRSVDRTTKLRVLAEAAKAARAVGALP